MAWFSYGPASLTGPLIRTGGRRVFHCESSFLPPASARGHQLTSAAENAGNSLTLSRERMSPDHADLALGSVPRRAARAKRRLSHFADGG